MYIQEHKILGVFVSDVEPQVFGLRAGSSLAKMPSDGRAGGPRLGLDTSLLLRTVFKSFGNKKLARLER